MSSLRRTGEASNIMRDGSHEATGATMDGAKQKLIVAHHNAQINEVT